MSSADLIANYTRERDFLASAIPGMQNPSTIQEVTVEEMTEARFRSEWINNNKACLIKGAISHWPALEKWGNKEYWLNTNINKRIAIGRNNGHEVREKQLISSLEMKFPDAINRLYDEKDYSFFIQDPNSEAFKDIAGFSFLPPIPPRPMGYVRNRLLIQRRAFTTWHAHFYDEFLLCQVKGAKKVILFPPNIPGDMEYVYHFLRNELYLEGQSLDKKLDFKPIVAELKEGDALYIPPYWHHAVHPLHSEINLCVVHCWASPRHKLGNLSNYFVKQNYKKMFWPIDKNTPTKSLFAISALVSYTTNKITGKISTKYL